MPFTSVTTLPPKPDVRVFFTGLLILDPNPAPPALIPDVNTCEVFVHRSAPDHRLSIEVRRKRTDKPDIVMMRHVGQLDFITPEQGVTPRQGMLILANGAGRGVRRFDPTGPTNPPPEGEALGLAIDLERLPTQTSSPGPVHPPAGRPSIFLNDAVFYTAAKTGEDLNIGLRKDDLVVVERLPPFASVIGANIYLDAGSRVLVQWVQQGLLQSLSLEKPAEAGLSYEIYIVNEPLFEAENSPLPHHDELSEYFNILPQAGERFGLKIPPAGPNPVPGAPLPDKGSTRIPCMPVIKGG